MVKYIAKNMNYNLQGSGIELSQEIREYLDKKLGHAEKLLQGDATYTFDITLTYDAGTVPERYEAAFKLLSNKKTIYARADGSALHEAIDLAVEEFNRELAKLKKKGQRSMREHTARIKDFLRGFRRRP